MIVIDKFKSWPLDIPPKIPPELLEEKIIFLFLLALISSEFSSPDNSTASLPAPISTPLTALILIIAPARSASNLPYTGSPSPAGTFLAFTNNFAPNDDPFFLVSSRYSSQTLTIFLSGQKNEFFFTSFQLKFL